MILFNYLIQFLRRTKLCAFGVSHTSNCILSRNIIARRGVYNSKSGSISIGSHVELKEGVVLDAWGGSIDIDASTFIGPYTVIYGHGGVQIGNHCLIAEHCSVHSANHTISSREAPIRSQPDERSLTTIGDDVWLGCGVRVMPGVQIGRGAVVGAGSVVTQDIPEYSVCVGVPAKIVRMRE